MNALKARLATAALALVTCGLVALAVSSMASGAASTKPRNRLSAVVTFFAAISTPPFHAILLPLQAGSQESGVGSQNGQRTLSPSPDS